MKRKIMMVRLEPKLVGITWQQATDADVWETYTLKSIEHPTPELKKGMQAMLPTALRLLELPSEYGGNCSVRAIQYDTIGDEMAFAVHVVKQLGEGNGGRLVVIKTPMAMSVAGSVVRCTEKDIERAEEVQLAVVVGRRVAEDGHLDVHTRRRLNHEWTRMNTNFLGFNRNDAGASRAR